MFVNMFDSNEILLLNIDILLWEKVTGMVFGKVLESTKAEKSLSKTFFLCEMSSICSFNASCFDISKYIKYLLRNSNTNVGFFSMVYFIRVKIFKNVKNTNFEKSSQWKAFV